jgi:hypothetical protein
VREGTVSSIVKRHPVLSYYVLVFAISWGTTLIVVGPGGFVSTTATSPTFALVGLASLLGPSLAGVMMTGLVDGRAGFRELLSRLLRWRVGGRWYAVALLTAPLVTLATLVPLSFASRAFLAAILTADDKARPPTLFLAAMLFSWLVPYWVLMVWVHDRTESLVFAMVMHVPIVVGQYVLRPEAISGNAMFMSLVVYAAVLWLAVGAVALRSARRHESAL